MDIFTPSNIMFIIGIIGVIITVYKSVTNPQINSEKLDIKLEERISTAEKNIVEIREKHLTSVETDLRKLNDAINELAKTVVRLSTIIDERIPKVTIQK